MVRIFLFLAVFLSLGASLAAVGIHFGLPVGWIGAIGLLGWAFSIRKHWLRAEKNTETEPSPPARILWVQCAGYSLLLGHLIMALQLTGDDLRLGNDNTLAIDSWTMIGAALATSFIFGGDSNTKDERDHAIAARGVRISYFTLIILCVGLSFFLAFAPPTYRLDLTHFVIGNALVALILMSYLAQLVSRLHSYSRDSAMSSTEEVLV